MANRLPASESVTFPHQAPDPLPHRPHEAVGRVRGPDGGTPLETLSLALSHAFTSSTVPYVFQSTSVHVANTAGAMRAASSWSLRRAGGREREGEKERERERDRASEGEGGYMEEREGGVGPM